MLGEEDPAAPQGVLKLRSRSASLDALPDRCETSSSGGFNSAVEREPIAEDARAPELGRDQGHLNKPAADARVVEGFAISRMIGRVLRHPPHQLKDLAAEKDSDSVDAAMALGEAIDPPDFIGSAERVQET